MSVILSVGAIVLSLWSLWMQRRVLRHMRQPTAPRGPSSRGERPKKELGERLGRGGYEGPREHRPPAPHQIPRVVSGGYQPRHGVDASNPPQGGSGLAS